MGVMRWAGFEPGVRLQASKPQPRSCGFGLLPLDPSFLMIGHHLAASAFCMAARASAVCCSRGKISNPRSASRDPTDGSVSAATAAALSLPMISAGVPLGAKIPYQLGKETDGSPISAKVGMSGAIIMRLSPVSA